MKIRSYGYKIILGLILVMLLPVTACTAAPTPAPTPTPSPTTTPTPTPIPAPKPAPTPTPTPTPTPDPTTLPSLTITSPQNGGLIPQIGAVQVTVTVANFNLVDKTGQANVPGEGHINYFLDVSPPIVPGQPAITAAGTYAATAATSHTWDNVGGGRHTFSAELVNNDNTPLSPPVVASVAVNVLPEIGLPKIVITAPNSGAILPTGAITVSVQTANFNLVDKLGEANASHEGHINYFLDVEAPTTAGQPAVTAAGTFAATAATSYTWQNVGPGAHILSAELVNNDHTPLSPPVVAKVMVNVKTTAPSLSITEPAEGAVVTGDSATITTSVSNFRLVEKIGQANVAGEGHINYFLDVSAPTVAGQPATTATGTYTATPATSYTWFGLAAGSHTLSAELVNNDNTPLSPPVLATVGINVKSNHPLLKIASPPSGGVAPVGDVPVTVEVSNVGSVGNYHLIYYKDVIPPKDLTKSPFTSAGTYAISNQTSYVWHNITAGSHIFAVQMVDSNFNPLNPQVVALSFVTASSEPALAWNVESLPGTGGAVIGPMGIDINDLAAAMDGKTIYAAAKSAVSSVLLYKSVDGGATWTDISQSSGMNAASTDFVAVAPDNPDIVVVASQSPPAAYYSGDGGATWTDMGTLSGSAGSAAAVYDVDISLPSGNDRYVGLAGRLAPGDANAPALFYYDIGSVVSRWRDAVHDFSSAGGTNLRIIETDAIVALEFSSGFPSDQTITAVSEQQGSSAKPGAFRFHLINLNNKSWDATAGFTGYPVPLATGSGIGFSVGHASISLGPNYQASDSSLRSAYVGAQITDSTHNRELGGIYSLYDTNVNKVLDAAIYSVAFNGSTLVAGASTSGDGSRSNATFYATDAASSSPTVMPTPSLKRPGGNTNVVVAWSGSNAVAGTAGINSAFAISRNGGQSYNDVSLIDATMTGLQEVYVTSNSSRVFLVNRSQATTSLWRRENSAWERVFSMLSTGSYIVRGAPGNNDIVFLAQSNSRVVYYSNAAGDSWERRFTTANIRDIAVESADVSYVIVSNSPSVIKSTNGGLTWNTAVNTGLNSPLASISVLAPGKLAVGSANGGVAYSTDGNGSWVTLKQPIEYGAVNAQVTASGLGTGDYIYTASRRTDTKVLRWKIGTSTDWDDMNAPTPSGYKGYGIVLDSGVLYVVVSNGSDASAALRTLNPEASSGAVEWSTMPTSAVFTDTPRAFVVTSRGGKPQLWAVDTVNDRLYSYLDTLA